MMRMRAGGEQVLMAWGARRTVAALWFDRLVFLRGGTMDEICFFYEGDAGWD